VWRRAALGVLIAFLAVPACGKPGTKADEGANGDHADDHAEETAHGPRGGRIFDGDGFRLELLIAEEGIPPEFRAYVYSPGGKPFEKVEGSLHVVLDRFGGRRDSIAFRTEGGSFRSTRTVVEPHSFEARVVLDRSGKRDAWTYSQHEGRVGLNPEAVDRAGIRTGTIAPRDIAVTVETPGEVRLNGEAVVQVHPRYAGVVRRLPIRLGDIVEKDQLVAVIQSNESLAEYEVTAPIRGTVVSRDIVDGQSVDRESVVCTIADLTTVWVDFALYPQIAGRVRRGQNAIVRNAAGGTGAASGGAASGIISYVGPLLEQDTRVSYGRIVLPNPRQRWQPGLYVTVITTVERVRADVVVPEEAIVRTSRGSGVFRASGSSFELQPVVTGRTDGQWTEIAEGLHRGDSVVISNAYLLKAELGKSEATHDH
jgi:cobalt-zinc-cadmium efflux system membrane fusion protein